MAYAEQWRASWGEKKREIMWDIESYPNFFSIGFLDRETGKTRIVSAYGEDSVPDREKIIQCLKSGRLFGFNTKWFDEPLVAYVLRGATVLEIQEAVEDIILNRMPPWVFREKYDCGQLSWLDAVDLIDVAPGQGSLKAYGGRMHSKQIQDLPYEPGTLLRPEEAAEVEAYMVNDLRTTLDLRIELEKPIELRTFMSKKYGIDLRSKSDAQVAEVVIKTQVEQKTRRKVAKPKIVGMKFKYEPPEFLQYESPVLNSMLQTISEYTFRVDHDGKVSKPEFLQKKSKGRRRSADGPDAGLDEQGAEVVVHGREYTMGIGGLHSKESRRVIRSSDAVKIIEIDVRGYYPSLMINSERYPPALGTAFRPIFRAIKEDRDKFKIAGDKDNAESMKIMSNGTFGKTGSAFSVLGAPDMMIWTTLTGQLSLLMLIERIGNVPGAEVVSANTDGLVVMCHVDAISRVNSVCLDWELDTDLMLESGQFEAVYSHSCNNYFAVTPDGKVKRKGYYAQSGPGLPGSSGLKKNPLAEVTFDAVIAYITKGHDIEDYIHECEDIRKFVVVRQAKGGAVKAGQNFGRIVRWYYAKGETGAFHDAQSGNTLSKSQGGKPIMELPDELPDDIDYAWYVAEAYAVLHDIGLDVRDPALLGRRGVVPARRPEQKTVHFVDLTTAVALCGAKPADVRERWIEYGEPPEGMRVCSKCAAAHDDEL